MAIAGLFNNVGGGGLFGLGNRNGDGPRFPTPINIGANLLQANFNVSILQQGLLNSRNFTPRGEDVLIPPWLEDREEQPLLRELQRVRTLDNFIDREYGDALALGGSFDEQATFTIFHALENLNVLARYASDDKTPETSLARLDEQFQKGLEQLREYLGQTQLNELEFFLGGRETRTETEVRLNRNESDYTGKTIAENFDTPLADLVGNEIFNIRLEKSAAGDDFLIDLSAIGGPLTVQNITEYINTQIEAIQAVDEFGDPRFDKDGDPISEYSTRFVARRDAETGEYSIGIDGSVAEQVDLTPVLSSSGNFADGSIFISSSVSVLGQDTATQSRITQIEDPDAPLESSTYLSYSGINLEETEIAELVRQAEEEEDTVDPRIAALRDQFRSDARDQLGIAESSDDDDESFTTSITDVDAEFREDSDTTVNQIVTDSQGNLYTVGASGGSFGSQVNVASESDVYLNKFDSTGNLIFSRLLGTSGESTGFGVTVDDSDNVIITGQTDGDVSGTDRIDTKDAFVVKYDAAGNEQFRYQLDRAPNSAGFSVTTDANGDIYLGGVTSGGISATDSFGGARDGLILKLDGATGTLLSSNTFGGSGTESVSSIQVTSDGNILVASHEGTNAVIRKFDSADIGNELYSLDLGTIGVTGQVTSVEEQAGVIAVSGTTIGTVPTNNGAVSVVGTPLGGRDGFVSIIADLGGSFDQVSTTIISTEGDDTVADVEFTDDGRLFVAGSVEGTLSGETRTGARDGYVAQIDIGGTPGAILDTHQFGQSSSRVDVSSIEYNPVSRNILTSLGLPTGHINQDQELTVQNQTSAKAGDYFSIRIGNNRPIKIELEDGDTYEDIKRDLNIRFSKYLNVMALRGGEGERLRIQVRNDDDVPDIELIAGEGSDDLLAHIGVTPGRLLPSDRALNLRDEDEAGPKIGGSFALGLEGALTIRTKAIARHVQGLLDGAITTLQRAYRSLTPNPFLDALTGGGDKPGNNDGQPSTRTLNQIANFQSALSRLSASRQTQPTLSLFI